MKKTSKFSTLKTGRVVPVSASPAEAKVTAREKARRRAAADRAKTRDENTRAAAQREAMNPRNPLLDLPEKQRSQLFIRLRECPYDDAVREMLREDGIADVTPLQLTEFFQVEAEQHWRMRIERAALEANALVELAERHPVSFSSGILAALGQEAFRQIASGQVEPEAMSKMANLFLKARADERTDQMQELRREKVRQELQGQVAGALEQLAEEVDRHPGARAAFEALRRELQGEEIL